MPGQQIETTRSSFSSKIDQIIAETNELGEQPLWDGYGKHNLFGPTRTPNLVSTPAWAGELYTSLVCKKNPKIVVEFGSAFGVSGMYFLAGLEQNNNGLLLTFEPNASWASVAKRNLSQIGSRFSLVTGTFEQNIAHSLPQGKAIDLAFIDAIHTKSFVITQLELVISNSAPGAIIILDDINFPGDMNECWELVSRDSRFSASATLGDNKAGILELRR